MAPIGFWQQKSALKKLTPLFTYRTILPILAIFDPKKWGQFFWADFLAKT
jgi:hypothetical protein